MQAGVKRGESTNDGNYSGRKIVELQTSLHILAASASMPEPPQPDEHGRQPFQHAQLNGLAGLKKSRKDLVLDQRRMAQLADKYGIAPVMRWKPRMKAELEESGIDIVLSQTLYAIVGAVSLQRGGEVANRIVKERILAPLGLKTVEGE